MTGGAPEDEAMRLALAEFRDGNRLARYMAPLQQAQTLAPIIPGVPAGHVLRDVWPDLRYAASTLRRQPTFSLTAILTLALGIGATTAMFSVVNGVVIKPLPYPESDNLVTAGVSAVFGNQRTPDFPLAPRMFASYAENGQSFQEFGLFNTSEATFVRRGMMLAGVGTAIGAAVAAGITLWMSSLLFGVAPVDAATFAAASVLVLAALAASYVPARRAAAIDPVRTLTAP